MSVHMIATTGDTKAARARRKRHRKRLALESWLLRDFGYRLAPWQREIMRAQIKNLP